VKQLDAEHDEHDERRDLEDDEDVVRRRRLADADAEQGREREHEQRADDVVLRVREIPLRHVPPRAVKDELRCSHPHGHHDPDAREHALKRARELLRHRCGADAVFEQQGEADDPGDELTERRVGVRVGAAGDRHHRAEFGVR
jgi:hypothetical protein